MNQILTTGDGSNTVNSSKFKANYHSIHGALTESEHIFIEAGFNQFVHQDHINILELGLGTGLNAYLTAQIAHKKALPVTYVSYEKFPIELELIDKLEYAEDNPTLFQNLHTTTWNELHQLNEYFSFIKKKKDIHGMDEVLSFDVVYYDAFSPEVQPELWTPTLYSLIYQHMAIGACLVTYCAKGQVKRDLKSVGFEVEALAGPPGKREITRAWKKTSNKL